MSRLDTLSSRGTAFLGSRYAIMAGAMTWVSERHLVSAISNAGGFGVIACGSMTPDLLDAEIAATKARTGKPFGVNLITLHPLMNDLIDICAKHEVGHVVLAGGLPSGAAIERIKASGAKLMCFAPALALAKKLVRSGVDALVIEGSEAGGHIGPVSTSVLAQEILPVIRDVPVFVAGGIGRGEAIAAYLEMGAAGVQLGTRFAAATESVAHANFKKAFVRASARDAVASVQLDGRLPVIPVRALRNAGSEAFTVKQREMVGHLDTGNVELAEAQLQIEHYWAGALRRAVVDGDIETGSLMAGQSVGMVTSIQPVAEIIDELVTEAALALDRRSELYATPLMASVSAARTILTRLHEVMAAKTGPQAKLNAVVNIVAEGLSSEVCSIYLLRDGSLELYATQGLAQSAVHVTKLALGQGLVGTIAATREPLNLAEARAHPDFAYRPETGEEDYHSFAGVPILRREAAIGVLGVQHKDPRDYQDVEIETLQTVAMVLAELLAGAGLVDDVAAAKARAQLSGPIRLTGLKLVDGYARGQATLHQPRIVIEHTVADDVEAERRRVYGAFEKMREQIDRMMGQAEFDGGGEHEEILETYKAFAYDEGWSRRINEAIDTGLTAEAAIERVQQRTRARMRAIPDPYLRERLADLDDLSNRLIRIVSGQLGTAAQSGLRSDIILLARNLGPAELLEYDRRFLKGVVLEEGSLTAHVTIVARAMAIPVLGRVRDYRTAISDGDELLLDGGEGTLFVRPTSHMRKSFLSMSAMRAKRQASYAKLRDLPAVTRDGVPVTLLMNAGLAGDAEALVQTNADGIGLFRTEFQFLVAAALPRRERQTQLYRSVLDAAQDKPVVFRTVDIGGDKAVPYMDQRDGDGDENPAMGWRALRLALGRSGLMKVQARALLDAAAGRQLNVMFPMVSEPWEFAEARRIVEDTRDQSARRGRALPASIRYGAMLEVPALAEALDVLLPMVDFLSIGTNDLTQFLFAADRANPRLADRYDWLSPSVLRFLRRIIRACDAAGVPVTVCGEMGGRPLEALALLALGVERLSITPAAVLPVKAMVRSTSLTPLRASMDAWLDAPGSDVRELLRCEADAQGVMLG